MYELTAAIASNAVAICSDEDYERSCRMFAVASRLYEDLNSTLREKLSSLLKRQDRVSEHPGVMRAFNGGLPMQPGDSADALPLALNKLGKQGSVVKAVARPDGKVTANTQAPSLLRLTREWRESASSGDARRAGDVIIHHLGRDLQVEDEESAELFGLLEASGRGDDPLSRLLESVQNRRERRAGNSGAGEQTAREADRARPGSGTGKAKSQVTKESLDICDRLYTLMREAEREAYRLDCRISAWRKLETGSFTRADIAETSFEPSHCSVCASPVALHLLQLWLGLLNAASDKVVVSKEFVRMLLSEDFPISYRGLLEAKRRALKEIALRSPQGAELVLEGLRSRLRATESIACAEILGKIVEDKGPPAFLELAMEVLETSATSDIR